MFAPKYGLPFYPNRRTANGGLIVACVVALLVLCAAVAALSGCAFTGTVGQPLTPGQQLVDTVAITGAQVGLGRLVDRVEAAYAQHQIGRDEYLAARELEAAAAKGLATLSDQTLAGNAVTREQLQQIQRDFIDGILKIVGRLPAQLPATQPA